MLKVLKTKAFYLAFAMTLVCSLIGTFLGGLPYFKVIGALVIALLIGMVFQVSPGTIKEAKSGIGFISNKFLFQINSYVLVLFY